MQRQLKAPILHISETRGHPIETANRRTTPIGRNIQVQLPFASMSWHRPVAVEVRQEDKTFRLPIHDKTSRMVSAIFLTGLATILVPFFARAILSRRRKTS